MSPGDLLGDRYRLDAHIATGGMGEVWRATDVKLRRPVAVKLLHPGLANDARFRSRFAAEARTVAALQAPGVVAIHDAHEESTPDGTTIAYLVMEYVPGDSLATLLDRRGSLDADETASIVAKAADVLESAHRAGIVHRDVKPGNIIVGPDGDVTIVDFGVARMQGESGLTKAGNILGTVLYAAPEQLGNKGTTALSDVYALGVVAYECLTGNPPFVSESTAAIITAHLYQSPPPLPPRVPEDVAAVVMRALAKDPAKRYASAAAFAAACRDPGTVPPPSTVEESAAPVPPRRRRRLLALSGAAAVLAVAGVIAVQAALTDPAGTGDVAEDRADTDDLEGDATPGPSSDGETPTDGADAAGDDPEDEKDGTKKDEEKDGTGSAGGGPVPAPSQVVSVSTGDCLAAGGEAKKPFTTDCAGAGGIVFTAVPGTGSYLMAYDDGEHARCITPVDGAVRWKSCDESAGWAFEWLGTDADGRHRWRVASDGKCLTAPASTAQDPGDDSNSGPGKDGTDDDGEGGGEVSAARYPAVVLSACGDGAGQQWRTAGG